MGIASCNRFVAISRIIGPISCHTSDLFFARDLREKLWPNKSVPDAVTCHLDCPNWQRPCSSAVGPVCLKA